MTRIGVVGRIVLVTALIGWVAGCASAPPKDVTLKGSIQASESVNPDASGRPSPVVVKIYQLEANSKFEQADYFPLLDDAEATLGGDLLALEEMIMRPGDVKAYEGEFDPRTRYIGVTAGFRDIHQAEWRALMEMPEKSITKMMRRGPLVIRLDSLSISVSSGE